MMNKKKKSMLFSLLLAASLCLQACGSSAGNTPTPTVAPPVFTEDATATPAPTATPEPTATTAPTATVAPTATTAPTATPVPEATATPVPEATATPVPVATATPVPEATATPVPVATATPVPTQAPASPEAPAGVALDFSSRLSVWGQGIGTDNADGSVTFSGGTVDKCSFPLPNSVSANESVTVTAKLKFNSAEDIGVRFYLTDDSFNNCSTEVISVANTGAEVTATITLTAASTINSVLFAASSYGVKIQDVTLCSIVVSGDSIKAPSVPSTPADSGDWLTTWATTEEKCNLSGPKDSAMPKMALEGTTIRQIIRVTAGGSQIRFRLTNQYGESDVEVKSMHIAKQSPDALADGKGFGKAKKDMSTIVTSTDKVVTVNGQASFVIPKGEVILTDPIDLSVEGLENIAVSMHFGKTPTTNITGHRGARATTYQVSGDKVSAEVLSGYKTTTSWYFLADCSVLCPGGKAIVVFGDSIIDGYGTDASYLGKNPDSYIRCTDYLAKRLQANDATKNVSILNEGLGSNSVLGAYPTLSGKQRFSRDVLEHDNVGYVIIHFGVNDIGKVNDTSKYNQLIPEYKKMVELCHKNGIKVYAAPILPFGTSSYYTDSAEKLRTMINDWMRSPEAGFDGIINFDQAVADPANPKNILYKYTLSDGLHPYEGYSAMADSVDLSMFTD